MKSVTIIAFLSWLLLPLSVSAHGMYPGLTTQVTATNSVRMDYELHNAYEFPAVYRVEIFDADFNPIPSQFWKIDREVNEYRLKPDSRTKVSLLLRATKGVTKMIVCTTLIGVSYEEVKPSNISRVCSRLIVKRPS